jgi:mono/diheme cytochrome c family protein
MPPATDAAYGAYLAKFVSNCYGCHTDRDLKTGEFIGKPLAGGLHLEHNGETWVPPNITHKGEGSHLNGFNQEAFVARVRSAKPSRPGSPMPWAAYATMSDDDLTAIWNYIQSVPSVSQDTGPVFVAEH